MKRLLIVESPAKIKTISKFLGPEYVIMSTMGHIKDLPARKLGVTINGSIELEYVPLENKEELIKKIYTQAKKSDAIYLAPDPDREGEIIAWHVEQSLDTKAPIHRITFNEITKTAIQDALKNPSAVDLKKVAAQQARRVLDRWVGYEVSPILWRKIAKGLSAGRVQSVALRLICDREEAIQNFKVEEYWSIDGLFTAHGVSITAALTHIKDKKLALPSKEKTDKVLADLKTKQFTVDSISSKERTRNPYPPFMTSTLQQAAFNQLGFAVKKTMQLAQNLYEGIPLADPSTPIALITYMRTDSLRIAESALETTRDFITKNYTKKYLPPKPGIYVKKSQKGQDAHEAIRPVDVSITPEYASKFLKKDLAQLYTLIWRRFVASQMKSAEYLQKQILITAPGYTFKATGSTLVFDGFLKIYRPEEEISEEAHTIIPAELVEKDSITLEKTTPKQHFTQPPARYSEASLVKELEKEGIGRPSTYATILSTIQARAYTTLDEKKRFIPTALGTAVVKMLVENLPEIMDPKFTAHMESDLDKIAQGALERDSLLRQFYTGFAKALETFRGTASRAKSTPTEISCPQCKTHTLSIRFGKSGEFLGCSGYPTCKFTTNFTRTDNGSIQLVAQEQPVVLSTLCPQCNKPLMVKRGKYGPFTACSGYPDCTYIQQEKASFLCPLDNHTVVKKAWRGGIMWGCSNYPKCTFAIFGDIVMTPCPQCKTPYLVRKKTKAGEFLVCSQKECGYTQK